MVIGKRGQGSKLFFVIFLIALGVGVSFLAFGFLGLLGAVISGALFLVFILMMLFGPTAHVGAAGTRTKWLFGRILGIVLGVIIIGGMIIGGIWVYNMYKTGTLGALGTKGYLAFGETNIAQTFTSGIGSFWDKLWHPEKYFGGWKNPQVEKKEPTGIEFKNVYGMKSVFKKGEEIIVVGDAKIYGLKDKNVEISFSCEVEGSDKKGEIIISGVESDMVYVDKGKSEVYQIVCTLPAIETKKDVETKIIILRANYLAFVNRAALKFYTLSDEQLIKEEDPFKGISEPLLDKDRLMRAVTEQAPVILNLNLRSRQPLTEVGSYFIGVRLSKDPYWAGRLKKIENLQLILPDNLEMKEKCDFDEFTALKRDKLSDLNIKLEGGVEEFNYFDYWCNFNVKDAEDVMEFDFIRAQAVYDYGFEKKISVDIVKEAID